jgi:4-hydroxy-2-oxoheptanedioate aldolase
MIAETAKAKLRNGEILYGVISPTTDPTICEYLALAGLNFYMMDGEHGPINADNAIQMIRACENSGIAPWARVRSVDEKLLLQFLDAGISGLMMPSITRMEQVHELIQFTKYPPIGKRGLGPVRAADYMAGRLSQQDYIRYANEHTLLFPQMEDIACLNILDEMLALTEIDGVIIGPRDLAMSMGFLDGPGHPEVAKVMDEVFAKAKAAGKVAGTVAGNKAQAEDLIKRGARILLNSVQGLLAAGVKSFV